MENSTNTINPSNSITHHSSPEVSNTVSLKPPAWSDASVPSYFYILEAQFHLRNITRSSTQFWTVISGFPPEVLNRIPKTILDSHDYEQLKAYVINIFEKSKPELFNKLVSNVPLAGKPSIRLQSLMDYADRTGVGQDFVRHRFIKDLPLSIQAVVAARSSLPLIDLGSLADDLMIYTTSNNFQHLNMAHSTNYNHATQTNIKRTNSNALTPYHSNQKPKICRSHIFYANEAKYCKPWCKWPGRKPFKILPNSRPSSPIPSINKSYSEN